MQQIVRTTIPFSNLFRHSHGYNFGCSDMYVVVRLCPKSSDIRTCEREIADATWMPIKEFISHPDVLETNRYYCDITTDMFKYQYTGMILLKQVLCQAISLCQGKGIRHWND
jgi:hypothetical protein